MRKGSRESLVAHCGCWISAAPRDFSLSLAAEGHQVHGVDFLDLNVDVCQALAQEHPTFAASFEHGTVEDVIARLDPDQYDLVLGLSVFHHLVHSQGIARVAGLCRKLSEVTDAGIFELALREEPLYWGLLCRTTLRSC